MKFVTFQTASGVQTAGWLQGDNLVIDMHAVSGGFLPGSIQDFLAEHERYLPPIHAMHPFKEGDQGVYRVSEVKLSAPIPRPVSIRDFYAFEEHVKTARRKRGLDVIPEWYQFPVFYFTNHLAVKSPDEKIEVPPGCAALDYELEIACVIGKEGRDIPASEAEAYIFGYCIMNDWSARDLQKEEMKVGLGPAKGKDFATSLGPYLVSKQELQPHRTGDRYDLTMTAAVNGKEISKGNFKDIYYSFAQMIERASAGVTLYPGEVIGSGTVGTGCILELGEEVHRYLRPGDVVELTIEGLGSLENKIAAKSR
ncbi:fumarylacetoacetate hydrolase family protein [Metabacillus idriensis]|uniref:fumarylacetoacetate hydrolase family protein n=1 Tax=Metabacillus idriensis TaxID=324768 RepID=UPI003D2E717E